MYFKTIINRTSSSEVLGTATYCSIQGIDVAAKTGTTNENYDRWLSGFTPYYTAVCWFGFDMNESINYKNKNPAGLIWSNVMKQIHSGLPNAKFEMSDKVITKTICRDSGKLANSNCPNTFTEYFLEGTIPSNCTEHSGNNLNTKPKTNTNKDQKSNTTIQKNTSSPTEEATPNSVSSPQNTYTQEENTEVLNTTENINIQNDTTNSINENSTSSNITTNSSDTQNSAETDSTSNISSNSTNNTKTNISPTNNEL